MVLDRKTSSSSRARTDRAEVSAAAAFTLDTSGVVRGSSLIEGPDGNWRSHWTWPDLSPFEQGYVEALFREAGATFERDVWDGPAPRALRFSDLAPETLAAIRKDCSQHGRIYGGDTTREEGVAFWQNRQSAVISWQGWKPLTVSLNDAGRVVFS